MLIIVLAKVLLLVGFTLVIVYPVLEHLGSLGTFFVDIGSGPPCLKEKSVFNCLWNFFIKDVFSKPWELEHGIRFLKCLTLRTGSSSDHPRIQYNHKNYMGSGLDKVIRGTCVGISHGRWGWRKALWPHLRLARWWVGCP
jgi:hypothetical protein